MVESDDARQHDVVTPGLLVAEYFREMTEIRQCSRTTRRRADRGGDASPPSPTIAS